jgi:hypothetical protein
MVKNAARKIPRQTRFLENEPAGDAKVFARDVCSQMASESPDRYLINMSKAKRAGKSFFNYLRNDQFSTVVALLASSAHTCIGLNADHLATGQARPRSHAILHPFSAPASQEIKGMV